MEHFQYGKQIGKILDIKNRQKRHRAPKHILLGLNSENYGNQVPSFENKMLDSEDADRRDSINRLIFSSFCRANEKLYNKPISFLAKWQDPEKCLNQKSV